MSVYPGSLDNLATDKVGSQSQTGHAALHDLEADAINKIETELGLNPSGIYTDVAARLNASSTAAITEFILSASPVVGSSGAVTNLLGVPVNTFADSANSFASWTLAIPDDWVTFDIKIEHFVASGTPANFVIRADVGWLATGDTVTVTNGLAAAKAASTTLATDTVVAGSPVTASKLLSLRIIRLGNDVLDTLAATLNIRSVRLVRAS